MKRVHFKMIGKMAWLIGGIVLLLAACANESDDDKGSGNFMTEREQAVAEEERTREEEERVAKEEYVAGHKIELQGDTPLDMFLTDVDRYDVMTQLGSADSRRRVPIGVIETYEQASYGKFQGSLEVTYYEYDGALSPRHERLYEVEWSCDTADDSSWELAEELIYFFEDQYGEYFRQEVGSDMTLYSWNLENGFDLDVEVGVSDSHYIKVLCYFTDQYYTIEYINAYLADYEKVLAYEAPELSQWPQDYWYEWSEEKRTEMTEEELGTWEGRYFGNNGLIMEIVPLTGKLDEDGNYNLEVSIYDADKVELFRQNLWAWTRNGEYFEDIEDIQGNLCTTSLWLERADYGHQIVVTQELGVSATNLTGIYTREGMDPATAWKSSVDATVDPMEENVAVSVPEEGIRLWFAEFGQDYDEFEYAYCDIDLDGLEDILIQSQNDDEIVVAIYMMGWDAWTEGYYYSWVDSVGHMGDWQWYDVEGDGLYAVVLYEGWQYIYRVPKGDSLVGASLISYGALAGEPAVYKNPISFTKY